MPEPQADPAQTPAPTRRAHRMPFGAEVLGQGGVRFRLWAPSHPAIGLELEGGPAALPMRRLAGGWHELVTDGAGAGSRYRFVLPCGLRVPDPASRFQPLDVHGPSEVVDPEGHPWEDGGWAGRPWEEAVLYELHLGAFTPEGGFRGAIGKLDHLAALGVTAIQLMPVAEFPGRWNWGYDGVQPFAPDATHGRPEEMKALVAAAHRRGLMVLLDVVYNHLGPEGNYLHAIAPEGFSARHGTPWGAAPDFDGPAAVVMREFVVHNALYWIEEFNLDGLRLDAVHAIRDEGPRHLMEELAERVRGATPGRQVHLVLEDPTNRASRLVREDGGRPRLYAAQWNDDLHHALHAAATGEATGHYAEYAGDTERLGRALAEGFAFQGERLPGGGRARGEPSAHLPPAAFVAFVQNHDQVGNRARGERIGVLAPPAALRAIGAACLLAPQVPMIFMGQEWDAAQPFPFFCDLGPDLAGAVREGRRAEFAHLPGFGDPSAIPDPMAEATFLSAKLRWEDALREPHAGWLGWHRRILAVRHAEIVPRLAGIRRGGRHAVLGPGAVRVEWGCAVPACRLHLLANVSPAPLRAAAAPPGRVIWQERGEDGGEGLPPWSVRWSIEEEQP